MYVKVGCLYDIVHEEGRYVHPLEIIFNSFRSNVYAMRFSGKRACSWYFVNPQYAFIDVLTRTFGKEAWTKSMNVGDPIVKIPKKWYDKWKDERMVVEYGKVSKPNSKTVYSPGTVSPAGNSALYGPFALTVEKVIKKYKIKVEIV